MIAKALRRMTRTIALGLGIVFIIIAPAQAGTWISATLSPAQPTTKDQVALQVSGIMPTPCHVVSTPPTVRRLGNDISVDVYVTSGPGFCIAMLGSFAVTADLGLLPSGDYRYAVRYFVDYTLYDSVADAFRVTVPPPSISGFWPGRGVTNTPVILFGQNFQTALGAYPIVNFNNGTLPAPIVQVLTPNLLLALQPEGTVEGRITVETAGGKATSLANYNAPLSPGLRIDAIWPIEARANSFAFAFGSGFGFQMKMDVNGIPISLAQWVDPGLLFFLIPNVPPGQALVRFTLNGQTATYPIIILP